MAPAPSIRHQSLSHNLSFQLELHFRRKTCRVFAAPTDVKLSEQDIVQPDLLVVCDPEQIKPRFIEGPPSLVVEIVCPSSEQHDRLRKLRTYAGFGVAEYWIVTPFPSRVEILFLDGETYRVTGVFEKCDRLTSPGFPGLGIALDEIFDFPLTPEEAKSLEMREPPATYRTPQGSDRDEAQG